jgi:integrase
MERKPQFTTEPYTDEEINILVLTFSKTESYADNVAGEFTRRRDSTILQISAKIGLRPGEALALRWDSVDWRADQININPYSNKQRDPTSVRLCSKAKEILFNWKEVFDQHIKSPFIFPSLNTFMPITTSAWAKRLREISKEAGIYKVVWHTEAGQPMGNRRPYSARKYFGNKMFSNTGSELKTMIALRQKKMSSIQPYINQNKDIIKDDLDRIFS